MSRRLGDCGLSRTATVRFLLRLRDDLENHYQHFRSMRHPRNPEFFGYLLAVADGAVMHRFSFIIDDSTSPDHLFIIDFWHESGA
jgi:hypothetical protein